MTSLQGSGSTIELQRHNLLVTGTGLEPARMSSLKDWPLGHFALPVMEKFELEPVWQKTSLLKVPSGMGGGIEEN